MHKRQYVLAACSALAFALLSGASLPPLAWADEAAELLGQRTLEPAVRTVIDDMGRKDLLKSWQGMTQGNNDGTASNAKASDWQRRMANPADLSHNTPAINQWLNPKSDVPDGQSTIAFRLQGILLPDVDLPSTRDLNAKIPDISTHDFARITPAINHWLNPAPDAAGGQPDTAFSLRGIRLPDINVPSTQDLNTKIPEVKTTDIKPLEIKIPGMHVLDVVTDVNARVNEGADRVPNIFNSKDINLQLTDIDVRVNAAVNQMPGMPDVRAPRMEDPRQVQLDKILGNIDTRLSDALGNVAALTQSIVTRSVDGLGTIGVHVKQIDTATKAFSTDIATVLNTRLSKATAPDVQADTRVKQGLAAATQEIDGALNKVKNVLDDINQKVARAVGGGLDRVKSELINKADKSEQDLQLAKTEKSKHDAHHPAYDDYCVAHCSKWDPHKKVEAETPDSIRNREKWDAENQKIQAKIDTADTQEQQFRQAAAQTDVQKIQLLSALTAAVTAAKDKMNVPALTTQVQAGVDTSADPGAGDAANATTTSSVYRPVDNAPLETRLSIGSVNSRVNAAGAINVTTGYQAYAQQQLASVGGGTGVKTFLDIDDSVILKGALNGAIGSNAVATQTLSSMGTLDKNQAFGGNIKLKNTITGAVNVAIGNNSTASQRLGSLAGSAGGDVTMLNIVTGTVGAAVGNSTHTVMEIGNLDGTVGQKANFNIMATAPIAAALGNDSNATIRSGVLSTKAQVNGQLNMTSGLASGAVAASIGNQSTSVIEAGVLDGTVAGSATVSQTAGNTISASLGDNTSAISRMAVFGSQGSVGGNLNMSVSTGEVITFALGANTKATTEIGVVDARVSGNVNINVKTAEVLTGTVGINTEATTVIGSVKAPVTGDVDIQITTGAVNTMAIGLSSSDTIYSKAYIGNVLNAYNGHANLNVQMGSVTTLGLGLVINFGALGTLRLVEQGCTKITNIYSSSPC